MWFAFRLSPQRESKAHARLKVLGFDSIFAHELHDRRRSRYQRGGLTTQLVRPLLTGYAVVRHDGSADWWQRAFSATWAGTGSDCILRAVVGLQGQPSSIPPAAIDRLVTLSGVRVALPQPKLITAGATVKVTAGPFTGKRLLVESVTNYQALVLLGLLGGERKTMVPLECLEVA